MMFAKRLRERVRSGEITCTIRIWHRPRVKVGGIYPMEGGQVMVTSIRQIAIGDITGELARRSGFEGVVDLLKVARHGSGTNVYLIEFEYSEPTDESPRPQARTSVALSISAGGNMLNSISDLLTVKIRKVQTSAPNRGVEGRERLCHCGMKPQIVIRALSHELPQ